MFSRDKKINKDITIKIGSKRRYLYRLLNPNRDERIIWLVVENEGEPVSNCRVIVEGFEYYFRNEWIEAPNGYEQKALKWRSRIELVVGKVDFATKGSRKLAIVKARRIPNPHFEITYYDGPTGKTHHFLGEYKLRVKIEAKTANKDCECNTKIVFYDIYFYYENTLKIRVYKILRVAPNPICAV